MSKKQILILLGVWIILFTFLGFPEFWDKIIALITGILIVTISYFLPSKQEDTTTANLPFVEYKNSTPTETNTMQS